MHRIPGGWEITLSDFSGGMLEQARQNLLDQPHGFTFEEIDAQSIPYAENTFDAVIANHMLYHVPDRAKALSEVRRVLKPGGRLYATSVGEAHMREVPELVAKFDQELVKKHLKEPNEFTLENGVDQLSAWYREVKIHRQKNALEVTEVPPLVDYILSGFWSGVLEGRRDEFTLFITQEMGRSNGVFQGGSRISGNCGHTPPKTKHPQDKHLVLRR
jgi:SAM-dependent methyltransferase